MVIISYLADVLTRIGERDLVDLIRVEPDLPLSALEYGGGEPLLEFKRNLYPEAKNISESDEDKTRLRYTNMSDLNSSHTRNGVCPSEEFAPFTVLLGLNTSSFQHPYN